MATGRPLVVSLAATTDRRELFPPWPLTSTTRLKPWCITDRQTSVTSASKVSPLSVIAPGKSMWCGEYPDQIPGTTRTGTSASPAISAAR